MHVIACCFLLAQLMVPASPAVHAAAHEPATRPANPLTPFEQSRLMQLFEGKQQARLQDMLQPGFWIDTVRELVIDAIGFIPRLIVSAVFLFVFWLVYRAVRRVLVGAMERADVDPSIRAMLLTLTKWVVMGFGLVIACNQVGIPIVAMLTGVSILGLAVGFAAQDTLANFIAGVVIFSDRPFRAADWLTVDGVYCQVQRITFRSCRLLNLDGEMIIFPNTFMLANKVVNHTSHPVSRVNVPVSIAYGGTAAAARDVLLGTVAGDARVRADPPAEVVIDRLGASSVDLVLRFWIADERNRDDIRMEYTERAVTALTAAGVEIPFPHVQVRVDETPAMKLLAAAAGAARAG